METYGEESSDVLRLGLFSRESLDVVPSSPTSHSVRQFQIPRVVVVVKEGNAPLGFTGEVHHSGLGVRVVSLVGLLVQSVELSFRESSFG